MTKETDKNRTRMKRWSLQARIAFSYFITTALFNAFFIGLILLVLVVSQKDINTQTLWYVCIIEFVIVLLLLLVTSPYIARKSIQPIQRIINTTKTIHHNNLDTRVPLPYHKETELYELSATINELLDRLEKAMEREKSFTSYASHEFRTPLAVLKGTMEVLIRRPRSESEYKERIRACIREVDKLIEMVEQLLILTRYEDNKQSLHFEELSVETLINNSIGICCDTILEKKMECLISISPENSSLYTDEYSFLTILKNLISNAVKYTDEEGLMEVKAWQLETSYIIEIHNTGKGIPQKELQQIFEKFYRSYSPAQSAVKGFGLGLAIVKRFCSILGIGIDITSGNNEITVARLTIPLRPENPS